MREQSERAAEPLKPLKWYRALATRKGRLAAGAFLVEGERAVNQVCRGHPGEIMEIIATAAPPDAYRHYPLRLLNESQFRAVAPTKTPQGLMALVRSPRDIYTQELPAAAGDRILLLEDIQDPGNVGTLIRTAAAFAFSGIILSQHCADPLAPKCVQASAGTLLGPWLRRTPRYRELAGELKESGHTVIAADLAGDDGLSRLRRHEKMLLALGNEASGLSPAVLNLAHHRLRIPIAAEKAQSLNVAACGAICMFLTSLPGNFVFR